MKIGVDFRFINDDLYSHFIEQLIKNYTSIKNDIFFTIYTNKNTSFLSHENVKIKKIDINNGTIKEQTKFNTILKKDKNDLVLFFNHFKPIFYPGDYIIFVGSLKDVYYSNFSNNIEKYKYLFLLEKNLKKAETVVCLDNNTKLELTERFNIKEEKIKILNGFFPRKDRELDIKESNIDIFTKYNLLRKFLIYSGGEGIEKNTEKLVLLIKRLKDNGKEIDLLFLGNSISKNIYLRNLVIKYSLQDNIKFLGKVSETEKNTLYKKSIGSIFPSFYEPFPFRLADSVYHNSNIISSDLENVKDIFGNKITYFSPISVNSMYNRTIDFTEKDNINDYSELIKNYSLENSIKQLIKIIK